MDSLILTVKPPPSFPSLSPSVLPPVSFFLAILFVHWHFLLPVESRLASIRLVRGCQVSAGAPVGCGSAELESRSEFPGRGGRFGLLCCRRLVLGVAGALPARYVPWHLVDDGHLCVHI